MDERLTHPRNRSEAIIKEQS
ncbi:hypothetical protein CCACVL1_10067 [Corchorus capsularis]|uniref:Uncharacterized protein n=1 Tax=Corchorus capsularis TaxID=210143 RepID=A0A1R3IST9_COCAP|nr:hypothetical protein CCACVL1_10067 [Corchorus capsularis]